MDLWLVYGTNELMKAVELETRTALTVALDHGEILEHGWTDSMIHFVSNFRLDSFQ